MARHCKKYLGCGVHSANIFVCWWNAIFACYFADIFIACIPVWCIQYQATVFSPKEPSHSAIIDIVSGSSMAAVYNGKSMCPNTGQWTNILTVALLFARWRYYTVLNAVTLDRFLAEINSLAPRRPGCHLKTPFDLLSISQWMKMHEYWARCIFRLQTVSVVFTADPIHYIKYVMLVFLWCMFEPLITENFNHAKYVLAHTYHVSIFHCSQNIFLSIT